MCKNAGVSFFMVTVQLIYDRDISFFNLEGFIFRHAASNYDGCLIFQSVFQLKDAFTNELDKFVFVFPVGQKSRPLSSFAWDFGIAIYPIFLEWVYLFLFGIPFFLNFFFQIETPDVWLIKGDMDFCALMTRQTDT